MVVRTPTRDSSVGVDLAVYPTVRADASEPRLRTIGELSKALLQKQVLDERTALRETETGQYVFVNLRGPLVCELRRGPLVFLHEPLRNMATAGRIERGYAGLPDGNVLLVALGFVVPLGDEHLTLVDGGKDGLEFFLDFDPLLLECSVKIYGSFSVETEAESLLLVDDGPEGMLQVNGLLAVFLCKNHAPQAFGNSDVLLAILLHLLGPLFPVGGLAEGVFVDPKPESPCLKAVRAEETQREGRGVSCPLHGKVRVLDVRVDEAGADEGIQNGLVVLVRFEVIELLEDRNVEAQNVVTDDGLRVCQE